MHDLELTPAERKDLVTRALARIEAFYAELPAAPSLRMDGARRIARALREPMPEAGASAGKVLGQLFERVLPLGLNTAGPGYLAYIPGGGLFQSAVADLVADATNRYVGLWQAAPGLVQVETNVIRWFCALAGLPETSGGLLTTGGSMANFGAVVAARHDRLGERFDDGVLYVSADVHHSVLKSARAAGFPTRAVRVVPVDSDFRMRVDALRDGVAADRAAGLRPAMVVASAGTTATGAVDPLPAIAELCRTEGLWFHVDAAYGGFFLLTERGRAALVGLEDADSVTLDPHKGLFLPYGTGCLLVRDLGRLRAAHRLDASYLPSSETDPDHWDFADLGPELSRDARGLRVWLPLKLHGATAFRTQLDEKFDLARDAARRLAALPGLHIEVGPTLSLFAFRLDDDDAATRRLMTRTNARRRVMITGVETGGRFLLRVCVLSFRTHQAQIDALVEDVAAAIPEARGLDPV